MPDTIEEWIQKKRDDWMEECRISAKQFDRASNKLKQLGLIDTELFNIQGRLHKCIKLNTDVLIKLMQ